MSSGLCEPFVPEASAETFDDVVIAHLDDAYRLARWLMGNDEDAEDVVQDASLRAFRYFRTFTGGNGRAWFLSIVRNTCRGTHGQRSRAASEPYEEDRHSRVDDARRSGVPPAANRSSRARRSGLEPPARSTS